MEVYSAGVLPLPSVLGRKGGHHTSHDPVVSREPRGRQRDYRTCVRYSEQTNYTSEGTFGSGTSGGDRATIAMVQFNYCSTRRRGGVAMPLVPEPKVPSLM